jgi:hypothetical protein
MLVQTPVMQKERAWKRLQTDRRGFTSAQGAYFLIIRFVPLFSRMRRVNLDRKLTAMQHGSVQAML